jgi:hypothetical protein
MHSSEYTEASKVFFSPHTAYHNVLKRFYEQQLRLKATFHLL